MIFRSDARAITIAPLPQFLYIPKSNVQRELLFFGDKSL